MARHNLGGRRCGYVTILLGMMWLLVGAQAGAAVYYVTPYGNDANAGGSWTTAKATIQAAMNLTFPGDQIWVQAGTYSNVQVTMNKGVALYGGFNGTETQFSQRNYAAYQTILDGGGASQVITIPPGTGLNTRIDGCILRDAGIDIVVNSPVTIANNVLTGAQNGVNSYPSGGTPGAFAFVLMGNTVERNTSDGIVLGAGQTVQISNNSITANTGNGIHVSNSTTLTSSQFNIVGNIINSNGNSAVWIAGGSENTSSTTSKNTVTVSNNVISQNNNSGLNFNSGNGEDYTCIIKDNLIAENSSSGFGGGVLVWAYAYQSYSVTLANNTIVGNAAVGAAYGGGIYFTGGGSYNVANNVIAFNSSGIDVANGSLPTLTTNDVYGSTFNNYDGLSPGATDISQDPLFVDPANGDYHLTFVSPCIGAGTNSFVSAGDTDLDGNPRIGTTNVGNPQGCLSRRPG